MGPDGATGTICGARKSRIHPSICAYTAGREQTTSGRLRKIWIQTLREASRACGPRRGKAAASGRRGFIITLVRCGERVERSLESGSVEGMELTQLVTKTVQG